MASEMASPLTGSSFQGAESGQKCSWEAGSWQAGSWQEEEGSWQEGSRGQLAGGVVEDRNKGRRED